MEIYKELEQNEFFKNLLENIEDEEEKKVIKKVVKEFTEKMEKSILKQFEEIERMENKEEIVKEIKKNLNG